MQLLHTLRSAKLRLLGIVITQNNATMAWSWHERAFIMETVENPIEASHYQCEDAMTIATVVV